MFDWLQDLVTAIADAVGESLSSVGASISRTIWSVMLTFFYEAFYEAIAGFFTMMSNMGAEIFELGWVEAVVYLFTLVGWGLFVAGVVVAIFDFAVEYQDGRGNIRQTLQNILKGAFACALIGVVPIELYKFCISLQHTFASDLGIMAAVNNSGLGAFSLETLRMVFRGTAFTRSPLLMLLFLIAFGYCVVKVFFQNIKRGGILLIQIAVGSMYMFSIPRGYSDGFNQWIKQVVALCLTAFLQTTLLYLGLLTFQSSMLMGLGLMLAAGEVPRIAERFGMDTSVKFNPMSVVHATTTAINLTRIIAKK